MIYKQKTMDHLKNKYGTWALITGATSGIGRELTLQMAEVGFNLVITGRKRESLNELATALFDNHKTETIPIAGDLSVDHDVQILMNETLHLPLGIIILNAGFGTSGRFIDSSLETELNMLDVNCRAVLTLAHHFTNQIRSSNRKGALVFLSSIVAFQGVPNAAHYAATKAYVQSLGEALAIECKTIGIDVLCAAPGPVKTGFSERARMQMGKALTPKTVAASIINTIGKRGTTLPGFLTKFLVYNLRMTPRWMKIRIMGRVMKGFTQHQHQTINPG